MQKYKNKKVRTSEGLVFDSKKEAKRWAELQAMAAAGIIFNLRRQVRFTLIPTQREPDTIGKRGAIKLGKVIEREVVYIADFVYLLGNGATVVEDTKGVKTKDYIIKRKLMLYVHGIRIREM